MRTWPQGDGDLFGYVGDKPVMLVHPGSQESDPFIRDIKLPWCAG